MYVKRKKDLLWKKVGGQTVILDVEKSMVYECNDTAGYILNLTSEYTSIDKIIDEIKSKYSINPSMIKKDILLFIKQNKFLFNFKK